MVVLHILWITIHNQIVVYDQKEAKPIYVKHYKNAQKYDTEIDVWVQVASALSILHCIENLINDARQAVESTVEPENLCCEEDDSWSHDVVTAVQGLAKRTWDVTLLVT